MLFNVVTVVNTTKLKDYYRNKTVLVTGHTGFKGAWLSHVLLSFGAKVVGLSLAPKTPNDIFVRTGLKKQVLHNEFDIREAERVQILMNEVSPDIVFHLAAQPLVRRSYDEPLVTIDTNVIGTAAVLEAVRNTPSVRSVVIITTDKVYENREEVYAYKESDSLNGRDPYSASKAAADIISQSYIHSFFNTEKYGEIHNTLVGIARAGNVIGGGDWSEDRLIPDIMRAALYDDGEIILRNPSAIRPWEHVLEPISGYLMLGMRLGKGEKEFSGSWNFGPSEGSWISVGDVTKKMFELLGKGTFKVVADKEKHEAGLLMLDITKAKDTLGWVPRWDMQRTFEETVKWYTSNQKGEVSIEEFTKKQIREYFDMPESV
ncbi:CDP-glucose 4,6-dehydratase [bacterium]|nr:CDP-glucose 4,6-dehydratase [bacterium]|tara:strand:+ start:12102 stop:13223 length:1122 start_codon:yes stop_codon:yes gene_type:complete